ncbi:hypothetical protein M8J76_000703 [Diaphorina citri]|nr:hypothetical protein M8J76_000703 [Diaphorina citri]
MNNCKTKSVVRKQAMHFPLTNNIDDFLTLNERGREIRDFYRAQNEHLQDLAGAKSLNQALTEALRNSILGLFLYEFNRTSAESLSLENQQATLDLLKFSYCKGGEAKYFEERASIFPHLQYALRFIEDALQEHQKDGKITLQDVYKQLTVLNLRDKRISSLDDSLAQFQKLQYLNLSWNQIQSIADFQMPQSLFHLNLEMNFLSDIVLSQPRFTTSCLVYLNLARNKFSDDSDLSPLNHLPYLLMLDLSYNNIHSLGTLWRVLNMGTLRSLNLIGNPCSVTENYFIQVVTHGPRLRWLDCVSIPDDMKKEIQDKPDAPEDTAISSEAELCIHCYRVLQFTTNSRSITLPSPQSVKSIGKKKTKNKPKNRTKQTLIKDKKITKKSRTLTSRNVSQSDIIAYRIEIECPILNETLHEFVDFVRNVDDRKALVPNELLESINFNSGHPDANENKKSENEASENEQRKMRVKEAEKFLKKLKHHGSDAVSEAFGTKFVSNTQPESPVMEFSPIWIKPKNNDVRLLSNMFYTQIKIHFVQVHIDKTKTAEKEPKEKKSEKKSKKKAEATEERPPQISEGPKVLKRTILHTIVLDQLSEPSWSEESYDFIWTQSGLKRGENLKKQYFTKVQEVKKTTKIKDDEQQVSTPPPTELTIHFGISLKRAHQMKQVIPIEEQKRERRV